MDHSGAGPSFVRRVFIVTSVAVLALLFWAWRDVLLLVFGAILIAVGLDGLARPISKHTPLSKGWSLALAILIVIAVMAGAGWLFGAQISAQISELETRLPASWEALRPAIAANPLGAEVLAYIDTWRANRSASMSSVFSQLGGWTLSFAGAALNVVVVVSAALFVAIDPAPYRNGLLMLFPGKVREEIAGALDNAQKALGEWLLGTLISMASIAIMVGIALWLLGVPAFLALALIAGLAQFVPLIGPLLAAAPAILLALTVSPATALWTTLVYFAASQLEANLITPLILKQAVAIPPALTLFAIIAMGLLLGPLGVVLAIPLTLVISILVIKLYVNPVLGEHVRASGS